MLIFFFLQVLYNVNVHTTNLYPYENVVFKIRIVVSEVRVPVRVHSQPLVKIRLHMKQNLSGVRTIFRQQAYIYEHSMFPIIKFRNSKYSDQLSICWTGYIYFCEIDDADVPCIYTVIRFEIQLKFEQCLEIHSNEAQHQNISVKCLYIP